MKVKDLIEQLSTLDQDLQVYCYLDYDLDNEVQSNVFDIESVCATLVERHQDNNGTKRMKFTNDDKIATPTAIIMITNDF
jgi:hypothetical protein